MRRALSIHPVLWATVPVLFLWARNAESVRPIQALEATFVIGVVAGILTIACAILTRSLHRGAIIASLALLLFFSYGRAFEAVIEAGWLSSHQLTHFLLGTVWLGLLGAGSVAVLRTKRDIARLAAPLTVASLIMVVCCLVQLPYRTMWATPPNLPNASNGTRQVNLPNGTESDVIERHSRPDVYYIILDGYAREDVLKSVYGYDNSGFTDWLKERGFYVADESAANYPMTHFSLASSMSLEYLDPLLEQFTQASFSEAPFHELTRNPLIGRIFQEHGYRFIHFATNFRGSEDSDIADEVVSSAPRWFQNEFMQVLIRTTAARELAVEMSDLHLDSFQRLRGMPQEPGPKFVFAHFILPHHPYVFDREGRVRPDVLMDMDFNHGTGGWRDREPYLEQLIYTSRLAQEAVDAILKQSPEPPIIILQSDHGTASTIGNNWRNFRREVFIRERLPILNAYHVPPAIGTNLYPSITPVNSFRLVCNALFQTEYPRLPDKNYLTWYQLGARVMDVTETVRKGAPDERDVAALDASDAAAAVKLNH